MEFSQEILNYINCPCGSDKGLHYTRENVLFCPACRQCYPIEKGIVDLTIESAIPITKDGKLKPRE